MQAPTCCACPNNKRAPGPTASLQGHMVRYVAKLHCRHLVGSQGGCAGGFAYGCRRQLNACGPRNSPGPLRNAATWPGQPYTPGSTPNRWYPLYCWLEGSRYLLLASCMLVGGTCAQACPGRARGLLSLLQVTPTLPHPDTCLAHSTLIAAYPHKALRL